MNKAQELRALVADGTKLFLTPAQAASFLDADPALIRWYAKRTPEKLPYPVVISGSRVKIPLLPFARFVLGEVEAP